MTIRVAMRNGRAAAALRAQIASVRAIERADGLTDEQIVKLREAQQVHVPVPR